MGKKKRNDIWNLIKSYWYRYITLFLLSLLPVAYNYFLPFLEQGVVDKGIAEKNISTTVFLGTLIMGGSVLVSIVQVLRENVRVTLCNKITGNLKDTAINQLLNIDIKFYDEKNPTGIAQNMEEDIEVITSIAGEEGINLVSSLLSAISGGIALFQINYKLGIIVVAFFPIQLIVADFVSKKAMFFSEQYLNELEDYSIKLGELVSGIREIRLFNLKLQWRKEMGDRQNAMMNTGKKRSISQSIGLEIENILANIMIAVIYVVATFYYSIDEISMGGIIAFISYALIVTNPIGSIIEIIRNVAVFVPSFKRYMNFLDCETEDGGNIHIQNGKKIDCNNLSFSYGKNDIIKNLNFIIYPGDKIAIKGKNGSGKTTLLNILLKFYKVNDGKLLYDETDVNEINIDEYREMFGVVRQDIFLFHDSLKRNIDLYNSCSDEQVISVLDRVLLTEYANKESLEMNIGVNGAKLSGGQKRKVALARILINKKPIIILDEVDANMDDRSMERLKEIISMDLRDSAILCVSHENGLMDLFEKKVEI